VSAIAAAHTILFRLLPALASHKHTPRSSTSEHDLTKKEEEKEEETDEEDKRGWGVGGMWGGGGGDDEGFGSRGVRQEWPGKKTWYHTHAPTHTLSLYPFLVGSGHAEWTDALRFAPVCVCVCACVRVYVCVCVCL